MPIFCYFIFVIILAFFVARGQGFLPFLFFVSLSMFMPIIGPFLWAYYWTALNRSVALRITLLAHVIAICLVVILIAFIG